MSANVFERPLARAIAMMSTRGLGGLIALCSVLILTRALGAAAYGQFALVLGVLTILNVPFVALGNVIMREVAGARASGDWSRAQGAALRARQAVTLAAAGIVAIAFTLISTTNAPIVYGAVALVLVFDAASCIRAAQLRGLALPLLAQAPELVIRAGAVALIASFLYFSLGVELLLDHALFILVVASAAGAVVGWLSLSVRRPAAFEQAAPTYDDRAWMASAVALTGSSLVLIGGAYVDTFVLAMRSTADEVGIYRAAYQLALVSALGYTSINFVIAPQLAFDARSKSPHELASVSARHALLAAGLALPAPLLLLTFGPDLVKLVLGADFAAVYTPLLILLTGQAFNAATGFGASLLLAIHMERYIVMSATAGALVSGVLTFTLAPSLGAVGAAYANAASLVVTNALIVVVLVRRKNADPTILHFWTMTALKDAAKR